MRYGLCGSYADLERFNRAGYDFWEGSLYGLFALPEADFRTARQAVEATGLRCEAVNGFFDAQTQRIVGGQAMTLGAIREYVSRALERAALLGCRVAVLGSGRSRRVPEGFDPVTAGKQFKEVLWVAGEEGGKREIDIAIEPLNRQETNLVNTVEDALLLCRELQHPRVRLLADLYHMVQNRETWDSLIRAGNALAHVHVCDPAARDFVRVQGSYDYTPFRNALRQNGYRGRISIEALWKQRDEELAEGLAALEKNFPTDEAKRSNQ